jgi:Ca2+-binding RTX toxin-like protein
MIGGERVPQLRRLGIGVEPQGIGRGGSHRGGTGDQSFAANSGAAQALHAGAGNTTLFGGFSRGADTFFGSRGNASITAGSGTNLFVFTDARPVAPRRSSPADTAVTTSKRPLATSRHSPLEIAGGGLQPNA